MSVLLDEIGDVERELLEMQQAEDDLRMGHDGALALVEDVKRADEEAIDKEAGEKADDVLVGAEYESFNTVSDDDGDVFLKVSNRSAKLLEEAQQKVSEASRDLHLWSQTTQPRRARLTRRGHKLHVELESICATVRNEYSTKCLKEDFINGLKELYLDEDGEPRDGANSAGLPDDLDLNVFCISANDYLKIQEIRPQTDGPPNTFSQVGATQIPSLRTFVHQTTAKHRSNFFQMFANQVSDLIDLMKLIATETGNESSTRLSRRCQESFEAEIVSLRRKVMAVVDNFRKLALVRVTSTLNPTLKTGAAKGQNVAMQTIHYWGSKTAAERRPDRNQAACRREGVYVSGCAGDVDFNQELCNPVDKEFGPAWQNIMDSSLRQLIAECEKSIQAICSEIEGTLVSVLALCGVERARLSSLATAASRSCSTAVQQSFAAIRELASNEQRDWNHSLLPTIKARMAKAYQSAAGVPGGTVTFDRMKTALSHQANQSASTMFSVSTEELFNAMCLLNKRVEIMIEQTVGVVEEAFKSVYGLYWATQNELAAAKDPQLQQEIHDCRNRLQPALRRLRESQDVAFSVLGIEREVAEIDVLAVDTWQDRQAKMLQQAMEKGEVIDLCDSDDEYCPKDVALSLLGIEREDVEIELLAVETLHDWQAKKLQEAIDNGKVIDLCEPDDENCPN